MIAMSSVILLAMTTNNTITYYIMQKKKPRLNKDLIILYKQQKSHRISGDNQFSANKLKKHTI